MEASWILDSYTDEIADEFENSVKSESTSHEDVQESNYFNFNADARASWGCVEANADWTIENSSDYVRNDFHLVWDKTVSGGIVGFHDYGGDLPQTTRTIDELIEVNRHSIEHVSMIEEKWIILLKKRWSVTN